jgi:ribosomal protein L25 (general stress protein Ctc)
MPIPKGNIICVTKEELVPLCIQEGSFKKALYRQRKGIVSCWPYHKEGNKVFVHYDGIKPEYQEKLKDAFCDGKEPKVWLKEQEQQEKHEEQKAQTTALELAIVKALENYNSYLKYYDGYKDELRRKAAKNASAIVAAAEFITANKIKPKSLKFYRELGLLFQQYEQKPTNERRLSQKVNAYLEGTPIQEIVTVPRAGNNNRALYREADAKTQETIKGWMLQLTDGRNYSDAMIIRTILQNCKIHQFDKIPSKGTLGNWLNANDIKFLSANDRYGSNNRNSNKYNGYVPLDKPLFGNDVWHVDGTRLNIIPHKTDYNFKAKALGTGKNRKAKATDYKFLYIIAIRDAHSGDIVGEWYGYTESRYAYAAALHSACMNTGALPHTLILDHFPGHNTEEWKGVVKTLEESYGVDVQYTSFATGKAQVERFFGTLQSVFLSRSNLYYGEGIKSTRRSAHRTEEYIKQATKEAKKAGFNFEQAIELANTVVQAYRNTPLSDYSRKYEKIEHSPAQLFAKSDKPNQIALQPVDFVKLFWLRRKISLLNQMFSMTVMHEECYYMVKDYNFIKDNTGKEFEVRYDPFDLSTIYVFDIETKVMVDSYDRWKKPVGYGPGAKHGKVKALRTARQAVENTRKAERAKMIEEAEEVQPLGLPVPQPELGEYTELTSLTPHEPKGIKEEAESDMLLENFGYKQEKDAWEKDADNIQIPGIDF